MLAAVQAGARRSHTIARRSGVPEAWLGKLLQYWRRCERLTYSPGSGWALREAREPSSIEVGGFYLTSCGWRTVEVQVLGRWGVGDLYTCKSSVSGRLLRRTGAQLMAKEKA